MVAYSLALLAGVCLFHGLSQLPSTVWAWPLAVIAVVFCLRPRLRLLAVCLAGLLWTWWHADLQLASRLAPSLAGRDLLVQGRVTGIPERDRSGHLRFLFTIERLQTDAQGGWQPVSHLARLRWYRQAPLLHPGDSWQLRLRMRPPRGLSNPGGFDYERWLFTRRIDATGYVRASQDNRRLATTACTHIDCWRHRLGRRLDTLGDPAVSGLLKALAIGDKSGIDDRQWQVLRATGTAHLMAISGLHVGLLAGLGFAATRRLWNRLRPASQLSAASVAALVSILAAGVYAMLAGFQLPTRRALIMVCVAMGGVLFKRGLLRWNALALALGLVLLLDPLSVLGAGFWLSFGAVAWIFYLLGARHGETGRVIPALHIQLALTAGLFPVLLAHFQQASLIAPVANLVAVPLVGLVVVPLILVGCLLLVLLPSLAALAITLAGWLLLGLDRGLSLLGGVQAAVWSQAIPASGVLLFTLLAMGCLLSPSGLRLRFCGLLMLGPLLFAETSRPVPGTVQISLLDVGQGLAAVVRTANHTLVYDAGPSSFTGFDAGDSVVVPFLLQHDMAAIDKLVISHSDNDHQGGADSLYRRVRVYSMLAGMPEAIDFARAQRCRRGQRWHWDGVLFEILSPVGPGRGNNASCVLLISSAEGRRALLTGDIEAAVEQALVARYAGKLGVDLLVAPHHGSATSSTAAFLDQLRPQAVIFPAGHANRFGFPNQRVLARYQRLGTAVWITGRDGAVTTTLGGGQAVTLSGWRRRSRHYWNSQ